MSSTRDFLASSLADALLPAFRRPVEDIIYETLDGRQVPTRTDFRDLRNTVDGLRGQVSGTAAAARKAEASLDTLTARLDALEARLASLEARLAETGPAPEPAPAEPARPARPKASAADGSCQVEGCEEPARARGFCARHYQKWRRGSLEGFPPPEAD